jgi:hypothetical protein
MNVNVGATLGAEMSAAYRRAFSRIARVLCEHLVAGVKPRVITNRAGDGPYLDRYYLFGGPKEDGTYDDSAPLTVMLHHFRDSDAAGELHSHPWEQSVSFILAGGYSEERRVATPITNESDLTMAIDPSRGPRGATLHVERRDVPPFSVNVIAGDDFHRVDLYEKDCWTLFITGRKVSNWAFWNRETGETTPWREFIARVRGVDPTTIADVKRSEFIK